MTRLLAGLLSLLLFANSALATTYYVRTDGNNSNTGTVNSAGGAWLTWGKAVSTMVAGDTTLIQDGTYTEGTMRFNASGTANARITLKAQNQGAAILSSTSGCAGNIEIYASYITVDGVRTKIDAGNTPCGGGHNSTDGDGIRCFVTGVPVIGGTQTTDMHDAIIRNTTHDASSARSSSIKCDGDNTLIENNTAYNGIELGMGMNGIVRNNSILGVDGFNAYLGVKFGHRNAQLYNNYVECSADYAWCLYVGGSTGEAFLFDQATDYECFNCVAYNNVIKGMAGLANEGDLIQSGCKDCLVAYNTLTGNKLMLNMGAGGGSSHPLPDNPTWQNNTLTGTGVCGYSWASYTGALTVDYNNFFTCTSPPSQTHAISGDPKLNADYTLQAGSPLIDAGIPVTTWPKYGGGIMTLDLATAPTWQTGSCVARPAGQTYDVGACERSIAAPGGTVQFMKKRSRR